jgi:outer membrane protein assembly factor BamB
MLRLKKAVLFLFAALAYISAVSQTVITPKWSVPTTGDTGWDSPAIGPDGTVYIGDISGWLWAVNPDGSVKWNVPVGTDISGSSPSLTADGSTLYIGEMASPGRMFSISTADGSINWEWTLPAPAHIISTPEPGQQIGGGINSTPAISYDETTIYFGTGNWLECNPCEEDIYDDRLIALDVSVSPPVLKWELAGTVMDAVQHLDRVSFWASPSIAPDSTIYIGNFNGFLYHVRDHGTDYEILHRFNFDTHATPLAADEGIAPEIWSSAAIDDDGTVYVQANDGRGWALNPDLTEKWRFEFLYGGTYFDNFSSPVLTANGLVIMGNEKGYVLGINRDNGTLTWRYPDTDTPTEEWWRSATCTGDGTLIIGSEKSGKYFGISAEDGSLLWTTSEIGLETGCFPAVADDGTIYLTGGYEGGLYAFEGNLATGRHPVAQGHEQQHEYRQEGQHGRNKHH